MTTQEALSIVDGLDESDITPQAAACRALADAYRTAQVLLDCQERNRITGSFIELQQARTTLDILRHLIESDERISTMVAWKRGAVIECFPRFSFFEAQWWQCDDPTWNHAAFLYRVKEERT